MNLHFINYISTARRSLLPYGHRVLHSFDDVNMPVFSRSAARARVAQRHFYSKMTPRLVGAPPIAQASSVRLGHALCVTHSVHLLGDSLVFLQG